MNPSQYLKDLKRAVGGLGSESNGFFYLFIFLSHGAAESAHCLYIQSAIKQMLLSLSCAAQQNSCSVLCRAG